MIKIKNWVKNAIISRAGYLKTAIKCNKGENKVGLGAINAKHNAYLYIKPIANGVVVECGNQIVGDEAVFYACEADEVRDIANAYLDVVLNDAYNNPISPVSVKKAMREILNEAISI